MPTRRTFVASSACALLRPRTLLAQSPPPAAITRANIAEIDRTRILAAATKALADPPKPTRDPQSDSFLAFSLLLPALAAAALVDPPNQSKYATHAAAHLDAWFLNPDTRLPPAPSFPAFEPVSDLAPLAEIAVALPFLQLESTLLASLKQWFTDYLQWLTTNRTALLARDAKSHHSSSWLLQSAAFARLTANDALIAELSHRFKTVTIRAQINADGFFPHELASDHPFRDSLFNLDLLAGACVLLSTRFDNVWEHDLQDGPGMRSAIARFAPYIHNRNTWPYPADLTHFNLLPCRRPALVFAGRAFQQADYVTLWRTLNPDPANPDILRTFPIRQPVLWVTQPRRPEPR